MYIELKNGYCTTIGEFVLRRIVVLKGDAKSGPQSTTTCSWLKNIQLSRFWPETARRSETFRSCRVAQRNPCFMDLAGHSRENCFPADEKNQRRVGLIGHKKLSN